MIMSIKRFLLKPTAKKERRQTVRYVRNLGHVKDQKILVFRGKLHSRCTEYGGVRNERSN